MLRVTSMRVGSCRVRPFAAGLAGWRKVDLPALATLIETPNANVLIDCGYGPAFFDATHRFPARAYRIATPVQLPDQMIVLTTCTGLPRCSGLYACAAIAHLHIARVLPLIFVLDLARWGSGLRAPTR